MIIHSGVLRVMSSGFWIDCHSADRILHQGRTVSRPF
jgi:hypothetical protein